MVTLTGIKKKIETYNVDFYKKRVGLMKHYEQDIKSGKTPIIADMFGRTLILPKLKDVQKARKQYEDDMKRCQNRLKELEKVV